jgi:NADH dehydrogenase
MDVLLVGGSGFLGTELAHALLERGHDVTVLSRSPDAAALPDGVGTARGDVTDYDSIEGAVAGRDAVVNLVALSPLFTPPGGEETHETVHLGGTENVVAAMEAHGVRRLLQVSALGADPEGPTAYVRAKGRAEAVVRGSDRAWTVVRPSVIFGDGGEFVSFTKTLTTPYLTGLPGGGGTRFQPIWVGDLAPLLAEAIEADAHVGETYELGGPEGLTLANVARRVYAAEGKSLAVLPIPMPLARVGLTLAGYVPGVPMGADQYRSLRFDNTVASNDVSALGADPAALQTLEDYLSAEDSGNAAGSRSAWTAPSTLLLFALLALAAQLPLVVDIYDYGGVPRLLFVPPYLLLAVAYALLDPLDPLLDPDGAGARLLFAGGPLVVYYLASVLATWVGRRLASVGRTGGGRAAGSTE